MTRDRPLALTVIGATGRLGEAVASAAKRAQWEVTEFRRGESRKPASNGVIVDTSHPQAIHETMALCASTGAPLVYCVSTLSAAGVALLKDHARIAPVVIATNLTFGHWLQGRLIREAARLLAGQDVAAVTVSERHPTHKMDSPSATALLIGDTWTAASSGPAPSIVSSREGAPVADHHLELDLGAESVRISHMVRSLDAAAAGALRLAAWTVSAPPGLRAGAEAFDLAWDDCHV